MKYVYYDANTGMIKIISPVKEDNPTDPFIEVEDSEVDAILSNRVNLLEYKVLIDSKTSTEGHVKKVERSERQWASINDWLYLIPTTLLITPEFRIDQYISEKKIKFSLEKSISDWWKENKFFQKEHITIAACNGVDPHKMVWWKNIVPAELADGVIIDYTGTDDLRFYTHRYFEEYIHEKHT